MSVWPVERLTPLDLDIPGDFSAAAPFVVATALVPGAKLRIHGVNVNSTRTALLDVLERMGVRIALFNRRNAGGEPVGDLEVRSPERDLRAAEIGRDEVPRMVDELPLFALAAGLARGVSVVRGAEELRVKETDRIATVTEALHGVGIRIEARRDGFRIRGVPNRPAGGRIDARGDHRIAMLGAVAGLVSRDGVELEGADTVAISFPGFFDLLDSVSQTMIVAIDGPAGAGKSTVARRLAERLGFHYLDTGAMYRALTWLALQWDVPLEDESKLGELARAYPVTFDGERRGLDRRERRDEGDPRAAGGQGRARWSRGIPPCARSCASGSASSAHEGDSIIEGRDIGTVVAPDAEVKVYLVADEAERARRRVADRPGIGADALATDLRLRDERDAVQMQPAGDAEQIDTTDLDIDQVVERIEQLVRARLPA